METVRPDRLTPIVTISVGAWLIGEAVTIGFLIGGRLFWWAFTLEQSRRLISSPISVVDAKVNSRIRAIFRNLSARNLQLRAYDNHSDCMDV